MFFYTAGSWYDQQMIDAGSQYGSIVNYATNSIKSPLMKLSLSGHNAINLTDLNNLTVQTFEWIPFSSFPSMLTKRMETYTSLECSNELLHLLAFIDKIAYWIQVSQGTASMASHFHNAWKDNYQFQGRTLSHTWLQKLTHTV